MVRVGPGLTWLARGQADPGPGPVESGLALRARVKGQQKWPWPSPAQPPDSVWREHCFEHEEKISPCSKYIIWCQLCSSLDTTKGTLLRINTYFPWHFIITDLEQIVHFPQHSRCYEKKSRIDIWYCISGSVVSGSADSQVNPLPPNSKVLRLETNICATMARASCGMDSRPVQLRIVILSASAMGEWLCCVRKRQVFVGSLNPSTFEMLRFTALVVRMWHRSSFDAP